MVVILAHMVDNACAALTVPRRPPQMPRVLAGGSAARRAPVQRLPGRRAASAAAARAGHHILVDYGDRVARHSG